MSQVGVLLTNIGTPESYHVKAVRAYLQAFLWDKRVVPLPRWLWWPILHGIILRIRPHLKSKDYQKIWTPEGSPLLTISQEQVLKLQAQLPQCIFSLGVRYGKPSIQEALEDFRQKQISKLLVFPLFPQYSAATTASTFDAVATHLKNWYEIPEIRFIKNYANDENYIEALALSVEKFWEQAPSKPYLLFSFHGLPQSFAQNGDPYALQCHETARLVADKLQLQPKHWSLAFQSRVGMQKWVEPYTDKVLEELPKQGIKNIAVICPGFAADCLETLEEMAIRNKALFLRSGGEEFNYIPALNADDVHIQVLAKLIQDNICGWET